MVVSHNPPLFRFWKCHVRQHQERCLITYVSRYHSKKYNIDILSVFRNDLLIMSLSQDFTGSSAQWGLLWQSRGSKRAFGKIVVSLCTHFSDISLWAVSQAEGSYVSYPLILVWWLMGTCVMISPDLTQIETTWMKAQTCAFQKQWSKAYGAADSTGWGHIFKMRSTKTAIFKNTLLDINDFKIGWKTVLVKRIQRVMIIWQKK